jgi:hypothetical protein
MKECAGLTIKWFFEFSDMFFFGTNSFCGTTAWKYIECQFMECYLMECQFAECQLVESWFTEC